MLGRRHALEDEFRGVHDMVKLFRNFFREEPFWSNKPLFPQLSPSKELALMNYVEPLADIFETDKEVVAKIELPGIGMCEELETGKDFGQHVAEHAQEGHLNGEMNPGNHEGYSLCVK